jgi:hypothetical protein
MTNYTTIDIEAFVKNKGTENEVESVSIVNPSLCKVNEVFIEDKTLDLKLKYVHAKRLSLHEHVKRLELDYCVIHGSYEIPLIVEELSINRTGIRFNPDVGLYKNIKSMQLTNCILKFTELPKCETLILDSFELFSGLEIGKIPKCRDLVIKKSSIEEDGIDKFIEKGHMYKSITLDTCNFISEGSLEALRNATGSFTIKDFYRNMKGGY